MKLLFNVALVTLPLCCSFEAKSQIHISFLFGDAFYSENIEFGPIGGFNQSYIYDNPESNGLNNFNPGLYWHINLKGNSYLSTGAWGKSSVGPAGMPVHSIGDPGFNSLVAYGERTRKINYFYALFMFHLQFDNRWNPEGGIQLGLRNKANNTCTLEAYEGDLSYTADARDECRHLDGGLVAGTGAGYKFKKEIKNMSVGVNYYYGLINACLTGQAVKNSSLKKS